ncbi:MAG: hypothetical protein JWR37_5095 [Mycobacterium sp.]|nr:hypothetical protein [Mycobacterium sp.]
MQDQHSGMLSVRISGIGATAQQLSKSRTGEWILAPSHPHRYILQFDLLRLSVCGQRVADMRRQFADSDRLGAPDVHCTELTCSCEPDPVELATLPTGGTGRY